MNADPPDSPETLLQHLGEETHLLGAVVPPIFQSSLFVFDNVPDFTRAFDWTAEDRTHYLYTRIANPTVEIPERKIAALERCEASRLFNSGMAAISAAIMSAVKAGAHVVCVDTVYKPTREFLELYLPRFGVSTTFVEGSCPQEIFDACRDETKLIYLESPSSFLFKLQDLEPITAFARTRGIVTIIDSSIATPVFMQPATWGVDLVVHSASKYLNGHSDLVAGVVSGARNRLARMTNDEVALFGAALAPIQSWLLLRGLRTLAARMRVHEASGNWVAAWLESRPEVRQVFHAGSESYQQKPLAQKYMSGNGGLFSFEPVFQDEHTIHRFVEALRLFQLGVSWGGFESLVVPTKLHPIGWREPKWVIRLYCGLESSDDLLSDLDCAFASIGRA